MKILQKIKSVFISTPKSEPKHDNNHVAPVMPTRQVSTNNTKKLSFGTPIFQNIALSSLYVMYRDIPQIRSIIDKITIKYTQVPYFVADKNGKIIEKHQIKDVITSELLGQAFLEYNIFGNTYLNFVKSSKKYVEIAKVLPAPLTVASVANQLDLYSAYISGYELITGQKRKFNTDEIFHFKTKNVQCNSTFNPYGLAILTTASNSIKTLNGVYNALITLFEKRGALGIISSKDGDYPIEDPNALLESYYNNYGLGSDKSGMLITNSVLDYIPLSVPINQLQPVEIKDSEFREMCKLFNIDSRLFSDTNSSTNNNFKTAIELFITDNVIPFLTDFYQKLSIKLDIGVSLVPDFSELNAILKDIKLLNDIYALMYNAGVATGNEWRYINNLTLDKKYESTRNITTQQ